MPPKLSTLMTFWETLFTKTCSCCDKDFKHQKAIKYTHLTNVRYVCLDCFSGSADEFEEKLNTSPAGTFCLVDQSAEDILKSRSATATSVPLSACSTTDETFLLDPSIFHPDRFNQQFSRPKMPRGRIYY